MGAGQLTLLGFIAELLAALSTCFRARQKISQEQVLSTLQTTFLEQYMKRRQTGEAQHLETVLYSNLTRCLSTFALYVDGRAAIRRKEGFTAALVQFLSLSITDYKASLNEAVCTPAITKHVLTTLALLAKEEEGILLCLSTSLVEDVRQYLSLVVHEAELTTEEVSSTLSLYGVAAVMRLLWNVSTNYRGKASLLALEVPRQVDRLFRLLLDSNAFSCDSFLTTILQSISGIYLNLSVLAEGKEQLGETCLSTILQFLQSRHKGSKGEKATGGNPEQESLKQASTVQHFHTLLLSLSELGSLKTHIVTELVNTSVGQTVLVSAYQEQAIDTLVQQLGALLRLSPGSIARPTMRNCLQCLQQLLVRNPAAQAELQEAFRSKEILQQICSDFPEVPITSRDINSWYE